MTARINHWLLGVFALATAGAVFIGEDAREPHGPLPIDSSALRYAVDHRTSAWITVARVVSHVGDPVTLAVLALVTTVLLWVRRRSIVEAAIPIAALVIAGAIEFTTKRIIGRPRPPTIYHLLPETDPSFPSGHATGSAAFFVALALVLSPRLRFAVVRIVLLLASGVLAAAIGTARVVLGVHWITDIAAGWLLGVAVAAGAVLVGRRWLPLLESGRGQMAKPTGQPSHRTHGPRRSHHDRDRVTRRPAQDHRADARTPRAAGRGGLGVQGPRRSRCPVSRLDWSTSGVTEPLSVSARRRRTSASIFRVPVPTAQRG